MNQTIRGREKVAPALAHLWRTKRGGNGASNAGKQSLRHRPTEALPERNGASVATLPSYPPKNKQEATENDLFQPIRTRFLERGRREGTFAESSPQSSTERHRVFVSF
ncbi:hypothetical protein DXB60_12470 [Bacteroides fragilis]|nr:hypothetical protein DXB60_12470 [Bacteroides fragilis]